MNAKHTVVVVDDHPLVREGVIQVINASDDLEVVAQGATAHDAVSLVRLYTPAILLLDVGIPGGGLHVLQQLSAGSLSTKIMMLTISDDSRNVFDTLQHGASGYALKGIDAKELVSAVRAVLRGERYVSPELGAQIIWDIAHNRSGLAEAGAGAHNGLSIREKEVLKLISLGYSNKKAGISLNISEKTVKHYVTCLLDKLHVSSRLELALLARNAPTPFNPDEMNLPRGVDLGLH
jgi:DNA-binding NarL/FixJ family response regulator